MFPAKRTRCPDIIGSSRWARKRVTAAGSVKSILRSVRTARKLTLRLQSKVALQVWYNSLFWYLRNVGQIPAATCVLDRPTSNKRNANTADSSSVFRKLLSQQLSTYLVFLEQRVKHIAQLCLNCEMGRLCVKLVDVGEPRCHAQLAQPLPSLTPVANCR